MGQSHPNNYNCIFKSEKFYLQGLQQKNVLRLKLVMKNSYGIEIYHTKIRLSQLIKLKIEFVKFDQILSVLGNQKSFQINHLNMILKIKGQRSQKFIELARFRKQLQLPPFIQNLFFSAKDHANEQNFMKQNEIESSDQIREQQDNKQSIKQMNNLKEMEEDNLSVYKSKQLVDKSCFYYEKLKLEFNRITALSDYSYIFLDTKIQQQFLFSFKLIKMTKNAAIGIADQKYIPKCYLSARQNHIACFYNDGRKFSKGKYLNDTEGGFREGDIIEIRGHLSLGIIQWIVNKKIAWTLKFDLLQDKKISWKPFALLINKSDSVRVAGILPDSNYLWIYFTIWLIKDCDYDLLYEVYHLTSGNTNQNVEFQNQ